MSAQRFPVSQPVAADPGPETFRVRLNGREHIFNHWSRIQWERTPDEDRPPGAVPGDRGGRLALRIAEPYDTDEELRKYGIGTDRDGRPTVP